MRFLLCLLCCLLPLGAFAQTDDRDRLTQFLEDNLSDAGRVVTVTGFKGALSSRATVDVLTIADDQGIWLTLRGAVLDWNRLAVLSGNIEINELTADEVIVARAPATAPGALPSPEATGFSLPELPVAIRIGRIAATRVVLGQALLGQEVIGSLAADMTLSGGEGHATVDIRRDDAGPEGQIALTASYANASGQLVLSLDAAEGAGGIAATLLDLPGKPAAHLAIIGSGPLTDFAADVSLATAGVDRLSGRVTTSEAVAGETRFAADLGGDLAPLFLPDYAAFFGPEVRLQAEGMRGPLGLDLSRLKVAARALQLEGSLALAPGGEPLRAMLSGHLGLPDGAAVLLPLATAQRTYVDAADIALSFDASRGEGWTARAALDGLTRADVRIDHLGLDGSGRIAAAGEQSSGGTFSYTAIGLAPADPALAAALGTDISGKADLHWTAGSDALTIVSATIAGADYALDVSGDVRGLSSGFALDGKVSGQAADVSRFAALTGQSLSGKARFDLAGRGSLLGGDFDVEGRVAGTDLGIGQPEMDNLLRGAADLQLSAARTTAGTDLRQFEIRAGRGSLSAWGKIATDGSTLTADLDLPDLSVLGPDYRGGLKGRAGFAGTEAEGRLTLTGSGRDLALGQAEVDRLLAGQTALDMTLDRKGSQIGIEHADLANAQGIFNLTGFYDPAGSALKARLSVPALSVLGGGYGGALAAEAAFDGTFDNGRLTLDGTGRGLSVGQAEADRLLRGDSSLRLRAAIQGGRIKVDDAQLRNPQVEVSAKGTLENAVRQLAIEGRLANLGLLLPEFPGPLRLSGTAQQDDRGYGVAMRLLGPGQIDTTVTGRVAAGLGSGALAIAGTAQAALANAFLGSRSISGLLGFNLRMNGPFVMSSLSGPVRLTGGRLSDPDLPFSLTAMDGTATLQGQSARVDLRAAASSGGTVGVTGSVGLTAPHMANLDVTVAALHLRDPELYDTILTADLRLNGPLRAGRAVLSGQVRVGDTELRVPSTGLGGAADLPGLRHANEPAAVHRTRVWAGLLGGPAAGGGSAGGEIALDLDIRAPNRVFVRGRGLDAELGGRIGLQGTTAAVVGSGGLELIRGRLDILGKRLTLSTARLDFQGDLIPYLEIVASSENDGITSSVRIDGRADEPRVSFSSSPELPQEEVLARLLFGQGLQNISAFQAAQLASAVATLAGRGGDGIVGRLRKGFGLDDLDLVTDDQGGTTLRAGKYISRKVYTQIEVDQGGKSRINLNLDIRPGLTAKGRVGSDGEAGLGVYLEKDY